MGKRGPKPGAIYRPRILIAPRLRVESDRQLLAAQHFNDRLDRLIGEIDGGDYPATHVDVRLRRRLMEDLETIQGAIIDGIESYLVREAKTPRPVPGVRS